MLTSKRFARLAMERLEHLENKRTLEWLTAWLIKTPSSEFTAVGKLAKT